MWLGEQITEYGIGNGISLLIFAGIVSRGPGNTLSVDLYRLERLVKVSLEFLDTGRIASLRSNYCFSCMGWSGWAPYTRTICKTCCRQKNVWRQSTHIPIKVNMAGVLPIIFATSFVALPATIVGFFFPNSTHPVAEYFRSFRAGLK